MLSVFLPVFYTKDAKHRCQSGHLHNDFQRDRVLTNFIK